MMRSRTVPLLCLILILESPQLSFAGSYSFITIDQPGGGGAYPTAINNHGVIVGSYGGADTYWRGFLLANGNFTTIPVPPGTLYTYPYGINDAGAIVGTYVDSSGYNHGFLVSDNSFTMIDVPLATHTFAYGINNKDEVVGSYFGFGSDFGLPNVPSFNRGFLLSGGTFTTIQVPPGNNQTVLNDINDAGQIVGQNTETLPFRSFVLTGDTFTSIDLPGHPTFVNQINNNGEIVGFYAIGGEVFRGFLLSDDTLTSDIQLPDSRNTVISGINDQGYIVGEYQDSSFEGHGFLGIPVVQSITVSIDVKPNNESNHINPKSSGVILVAILSTNDFDANTVDEASLKFGPSQALPEGRDRLEDVNGDGLADLVLHFRTQESGIKCGDSFVSITGQTVNGESIQGTDAIRTVGCNAKPGKKK